MATVDATTTTETESSGSKQQASGEAAVPKSRRSTFSGANLALRVLLFAVTLAGLILLATAKQTPRVPVPHLPGFFAPLPTAKFDDSLALIYLLVALCVTCFYSLLTGLASLRLIFGSSATKTLFLLVLLDVLYAAIMASATGSAGSVAWIGLKGNTHTNWSKICNRYGEFCRHIGSSVFLGLVASIILVLLTVLNAHSLYRCSR